MNNYAEQIKQSVTMRQICDAYGIEVNRAGFCLCPFHSERTPSMKIYGGEKGCHCFGCGKSYDVIGFVKDYFNLSFPAALDKLNTDFHLCLPIGEKLTPAEEAAARRASNERKRAQIERKAQYNSVKRSYDTALDRFAAADKKRRTEEKNSINGEITEEYAKALKDFERAKYELDEAEMRLWEYEQRSNNNS